MIEEETMKAYCCQCDRELTLRKLEDIREYQFDPDYYVCSLCKIEDWKKEAKYYCDGNCHDCESYTSDGECERGLI